MSGSTNPQDTRFVGNKGLKLATPAVLATRLMQYEALAANPTTPSGLRDYAITTTTEVREELARRAPREGRAA